MANTEHLPQGFRNGITKAMAPISSQFGPKTRNTINNISLTSQTPETNPGSPGSL
ncbi:MAG: hypothetical protein ACOC2E_02165 [Bacteroidota bacterium]